MNTLKDDAGCAIVYLKNLSSANPDHPATERTDALLQVAIKNGIEDAVWNGASGEFAHAMYIMLMYICSSEIYAALNEEPDDKQSQKLLLASMLVGLAEMDVGSSWTYGSKLLLEIRKAGIRLERDEIRAFLAQEGDFVSNRSKGNLMKDDMLSVSVYCGRLMALYNILPRLPKPSAVPDDFPKDQLVTADVLQDFNIEDPREQIETAVRTYFPIVLGEGNDSKIEAFLAYLVKSDFYQAPASTKYHGCHPGELAVHTCNVMYRGVQLMLPTSRENIAKMVMAAICHDLCKIDVYSPYSKNTKVYYNFDDHMPFGHGRKSLYIAAAYFPDIPMDVASAIDAHMMDTSANPNVERQVMEEPLGLWLHLADCIATYLDEAE